VPSAQHQGRAGEGVNKTLENIAIKLKENGWIDICHSFKISQMMADCHKTLNLSVKQAICTHVMWLSIVSGKYNAKLKLLRCKVNTLPHRPDAVYETASEFMHSSCESYDDTGEDTKVEELNLLLSSFYLFFLINYGSR